MRARTESTLPSEREGPRRHGRRALTSPGRGKRAQTPPPPPSRRLWRRHRRDATHSSIAFLSPPSGLSCTQTLMVHYCAIHSRHSTPRSLRKKKKIRRAPFSLSSLFLALSPPVRNLGTLPPRLFSSSDVRLDISHYYVLKLIRLSGERQNRRGARFTENPEKIHFQAVEKGKAIK